LRAYLKNDAGTSPYLYFSIKFKPSFHHFYDVIIHCIEVFVNIFFTSLKCFIDNDVYLIYDRVKKGVIN